MRHLRQRDFHAILEIVEELYSYRTPEECEIGMVRSLQRAIGCSSFHMSGINPGLRRARWSSSWRSGQPTFMTNIREVFERHMHEHPFLEHWDGGQAVFKPATLSDLVSRPSWHDTTLYNEVYRPFRIEHMLGVAVRVSRPSKMHVVAMRETTDFDDRPPRARFAGSAYRGGLSLCGGLRRPRGPACRSPSGPRDRWQRGNPARAGPAHSPDERARAGLAGCAFQRAPGRSGCAACAGRRLAAAPGVHGEWFRRAVAATRYRARGTASHD